jgi:hypothetical protein
MPPRPRQTRRPRRPSPSIALAAAAACSLAGCASQGAGNDAGDRGAPDPGRAEADAFAPRELRVHPLTRLQLKPETGPPHIDAHIELLDAAGDTVKAMGRLTFVLYSGERVRQARRQIAIWEVSGFDDPDLNAQAFDHITRTYRFRLEGLPVGLDPTAGLVLEASLTRSDGSRVSSTHAF